MSTYTTPLGDIDSANTDGELGPQAQIDRDRPPTGTFVWGPSYNGTCFIIDGNLLYFCKPKQPEAWPDENFIEVGPKSLPGVMGLFHNGQAYYLNERQVWYIQGTGQGLFQPIGTDARAGAQSVFGAVSVAGKGIYHTGPDGIYLFANGNDRKVTEDAFEPIFRGETKNDIPGASDMTNSWLHAYKNIVYFGYRSAGEEYPGNILVFNLEDNRVSYYQYDGVETASIANDITNSRILTGGGDGFIRVIETGTQDEGSDIDWEIQSKDFTLQTRRHFPRWVKYDVDASLATSVTGRLILDDAIHHSHTITGSRNTKRRLVGTGNGNKSAVRISGSGPATIYSVEFE